VRAGSLRSIRWTGARPVRGDLARAPANNLARTRSTSTPNGDLSDQNFPMLEDSILTRTKLRDFLFHHPGICEA
jgi:hypothetical protein